MEYIRSQLFRVKKSGGEEDLGRFEERAIVIHPGQVEEATHSVSLPGILSLAELRFWAYVPDPSEKNHEPNSHTFKSESDQGPSLPPNNNDGVQQQHHLNYSNRRTGNSYIDIVVVEIPAHCTSVLQPSCDLPKYGIGKMVHLDETKFLSLCDETTGRLSIDHSIFSGYHTELHIPPSGMIMKDRITDPRARKIPSFPSEDTKYEVLIANCDRRAYGKGRNVGLSGQIVFESDPWLETAISSQKGAKSGSTRSQSSNPHHYLDRIGTYHQQVAYGGPPLDVVSQMKLLAIGLSVCLLFSLFSLRIRRGTRADYFRARMNPSDRILNNVDGSGDDDEDDDGNHGGAFVV
mmetsp:Transcript_23616/g.65528  ORF Transcript_23616/g.65528 Transcript_23616/m.65528 type:complete len:348 (-) Transcript_23616:6-1049(-)